MPGSVTRHRRSHDRFVEARVFLGEIPEEKMGMSTGALPSYNTLQRFEARCRNGAIMRAAEQEALAAFDKSRKQPTRDDRTGNSGPVLPVGKEGSGMGRTPPFRGAW